MGRKLTKEKCINCGDKFQTKPNAPYCTYKCKCEYEKSYIICRTCKKEASPTREHQLYCSRYCADQYREGIKKLVGPVVLTWMDSTGKQRSKKVRLRADGKTMTIPKNIREKIAQQSEVTTVNNKP